MDPCHPHSDVCQHVNARTCCVPGVTHCHHPDHPLAPPAAAAVLRACCPMSLPGLRGQGAASGHGAASRQGAASRHSPRSCCTRAAARLSDPPPGGPPEGGQGDGTMLWTADVRPRGQGARRSFDGGESARASGGELSQPWEEASSYDARVRGSPSDLRPSTSVSSPRQGHPASPAYEDDTIAAIVTAVASQQPGAVGIIRVSGKEAVAVATQVFRPFKSSKLRNDPTANTVQNDAPERGSPGDGAGAPARWHPVSHRVEYGYVVDPATGRTVDEVLVVAMLAPRSYTREDVVELQCHGGLVCVRSVLDACLQAGARLARPGEFTLRAFLNGRIDLTRAESIQQLVAARTPDAAMRALAGMKGGISEAVSRLRAECIDLLAEMEARIDFDDELPPLDTDALIARIAALQESIKSVLATQRRGTLLQAGLKVAIVGRPNVGKSSLLNRWTNTSRSIVTAIPGTTRDVVEAGLVVGGIPVTLMDTAGIRHTNDAVERIGVQRSRVAAQQADILIMLMDATVGFTQDDRAIFDAIFIEAGGDEGGGQPDAMGGPVSAGSRNAGAELAARGALAGMEESNPNMFYEQAASHGPVNTMALLVANKVDLCAPNGLGPGGSRPQDGDNRVQESSGDEVAGNCSQMVENNASVPAAGAEVSPGGSSVDPLRFSELPEGVRSRFYQVVPISARTGSGLDMLEAALLAAVGAGNVGTEGAAWAVNQRQAESLLSASTALKSVTESIRGQLPIDFWTIDIRTAALALGEITGEDVTENVLSIIFNRFCIGK
eukprot:jgi/Mesvir1/22239/Mv07734-RA.1